MNEGLCPGPVGGGGVAMQGSGKRVPGVLGDEARCNAVRTKVRIKPAEIDWRD